MVKNKKEKDGKKPTLTLERAKESKSLVEEKKVSYI